jgi:hypothetical protein
MSMKKNRVATIAEDELLARRQVSRRVVEVSVEEDRRKSSRRATPGLGALIRMLFVGDGRQTSR